MNSRRHIFCLLTLFLPHGYAAPTATFFERLCYDCHDKETKKGGLDLTTLTTDYGKRDLFDEWVKVHDRMARGEMPPPKAKTHPSPAELAQATASLDEALTAADLQRRDAEGRAVIRRLSRTEYENTLRDLFSLQGLAIKDMLPADGTRGGYDKVGEALDLSDVQLAKYLEAADFVLDAAIATQPVPPPVLRKRIYPASLRNFCKAVGAGNSVLVMQNENRVESDPLWPAPGQLLGQDYMESYTAAKKAGVMESRSAVGCFHPNDNYLQTDYGFEPLYAGRYRLRISLWSFMWHAGSIQASPKTEVAMLHIGEKTLGYFDAPSLTPLVSEITPWLNPGELVFFDSASLFLHELGVRQLPGGAAGYTGPAIATDWLEVEGPFYEQWPPQSHRVIFGDLPIKPFDPASGVRPPRHADVNPTGRFWPTYWDLPESARNQKLCTVASSSPVDDATRLLRSFLPRAFRRPVEEAELQRYVDLVKTRLATKHCFEDAMRFACKAALTSTSFLFRVERERTLSDLALASRLSFWLWNSEPDDTLLNLAIEGKLHQPEIMDAQVERLLADPKSDRFVNDFLDQWLKLRDIDVNVPDPKLYPESHRYLKESMVAESRAFMRELIDHDLSATNVIASDFLMLNERLAEHYRFVGPKGCKIQRVSIPPDCERSGFITQASVLKVTANGTTTSPVIRGIWFNERILGNPIPPQPAGVPAIDPDTHGAATIREQLAKHRADPVCAACHAKLDPPGFALEAFDVIGGLRSRYRSLGEGDPTSKVFPGDWRPVYKMGPAVNCTGQLIDGRAFKDITDLRRQLLADPDQITRNLAQQILIYATGATPNYSDRRSLDKIVSESRDHHYGVRNLIHVIARSDLFQCK